MKTCIHPYLMSTFLIVDLFLKVVKIGNIIRQLKNLSFLAFHGGHTDVGLSVFFLSIDKVLPRILKLGAFYTPLPTAHSFLEWVLRRSMLISS